MTGVQTCALPILEGKALLVVKCVGLGAAAMAVYALALVCLRQEDLLLFLGRKKCPKEDEFPPNP